MVHAHKPSDAYLSLAFADRGASGRLEFAVRDLDHLLGLDDNADGAISWGELSAADDEVEAYALSRIVLRADGRRCPLGVTGHSLNERSDGAYAVLLLASECGAPASSVEIEYRALFDVDAWHRAVAIVSHGNDSQSAILSRERPVARLAVESSRWPLTTFRQFAGEGVWHIFHGIDHLLFLLTLLLPVVLKRRGNRWIPEANARVVALEATLLVTAFSVSHSLSLAAGVLDIVRLPATVVEPAIAASVLLAALNNVLPVVVRKLWIAAFAFGLVHGLGFATALAELEFPTDTLWAALAGFNVGVELGQLAVVAALLPAAYLLRQHWAYPKLVLRTGSAVIMLVAFIWLIDRIDPHLLAALA